MVSIVEVTVAPTTMASSASRNDEPRRLSDLKRNRADIATRARLFEGLEAKNSSHADKATALLKLLTGGFFTEGRMTGRARDSIVAHLARPGFFDAYFDAQVKAGCTADKDAAMIELMDNLTKVGITAESGLKDIAA